MISSGSLSRVRALSIMAGSDASDERELNATACAGRAARANSIMGTPPSQAAIGYSTRIPNTMVMAATRPMYPARAPIAEKPRRAARASASAKTPTGAVHRIHCTSVMAASRIASNTRTTVARRSPDKPATARPKASVKTMRGSIAPSAAARTGFAGTRSINHCAKPGIRRTLSAVAVAVCDALACSAACAPGSMSKRPRIGGASRAAKIAPANRVTRNSAIARTPTLPSAAGFGVDAIPATRLPTTSGMTVMRIALMNNVPIGSIHLATLDSVAFPLDETRRPSPSPATSAIRTRVVSDMGA